MRQWGVADSGRSYQCEGGDRSPIVATTPLFSLVISLIFLRGKEQVTGLTIFGTVAVVAGSGRYRRGKVAMLLTA